MPGERAGLRTPVVEDETIIANTNEEPVVVEIQQDETVCRLERRRDVAGWAVTIPIWKLKLPPNGRTFEAAFADAWCAYKTVWRGFSESMPLAGLAENLDRYLQVLTEAAAATPVNQRRRVPSLDAGMPPGAFSSTSSTGLDKTLCRPSVTRQLAFVQVDVAREISNPIMAHLEWIYSRPLGAVR